MVQVGEYKPFVPGIRAMAAVAFASFVGLSAGCATDGVRASDGVNPTTASTGTSIDQRPSSATLDDLSVVVTKTIDLPRMSFELDVSQSLPGSDSPVVSRRSGSFDDDTFSGTGTRSFETDDQAISEAVGTEPFRFIVTDSVLWLFNPIDETPSWFGFDLVEFGEQAGGDPLSSVDVDYSLQLIFESTNRVTQMEELESGEQVWILEVRADELVPLLLAGGPASRLTEMGAADSGLLVEVQMNLDVDGYITRLSGEMDQWWTNAIVVGGLGNGAQAMSFQIRLEQFSESLHPQPPCTEPRTEDDEAGNETLVCPAQ